jgi:hypothetical protein
VMKFIIFILHVLFIALVARVSYKVGGNMVRHAMVECLWDKTVEGKYGMSACLYERLR